MHDVVLKQVSSELSREENVNRMRQTLQIILLKILHESTSGAALAFTGGTALRLLHDLPRFSEDLDFSLVKPEKYNFDRLVAFVDNTLKKLLLPADCKVNNKKTVHQLFIRFQDILYEAGLTPLRDQKLPIRMEIDTNPPAGWYTEISLLSEIYTFPVLHFDLPSAFATKLHACLFRKYAKGRDYYDLMWYLGKKVRPNLKVLKNATAQTEIADYEIDNSGLGKMLLAKLETLNTLQLQRDVAPFLLHPEEIRLLDSELMRKAISHYGF